MNTNKIHTKNTQTTSIRRLLCPEVPLDRATLQPGELEVAIETEDLQGVLRDFHRTEQLTVYPVSDEALRATCLEVPYTELERPYTVSSHSGFEEEKALDPQENGGLGAFYPGMLRKEPTSYWLLAAQAQRYGGL